MPPAQRPNTRRHSPMHVWLFRFLAIPFALIANGTPNSSHLNALQNRNYCIIGARRLLLLLLAHRCCNSGIVVRRCFMCWLWPMRTVTTNTCTHSRECEVTWHTLHTRDTHKEENHIKCGTSTTPTNLFTHSQYRLADRERKCTHIHTGTHSHVNNCRWYWRLDRLFVFAFTH